MPYSIEQYIDIESDELPYKTKWGTEIDVIKGQCPNCHVELENMKFVANEYVDICIIRSVGICPSCKSVVTIQPLRITCDDEYYFLGDNKWVAAQVSWINRFRNWCRKIFG